jgi:maleate isomerase
MSLYSAARIGVIVPSGNAAAEPEIAQLTRHRATVHTARFPWLPGRPLRRRLDVYNEVLPEVLTGFGGLALDAAVVACSGSHYLLGAEGDRAFCGRFGEQAGYPVASSTLATLDTCADLGITEVVLASPYEPWLTELSADYWTQAGLRVREVLPLRAGERFSPYDVTPQELVRQVEQAGPGPDAVLLFTGTGMFTFDALEILGAGNERVLLTSNICAARWALKHTGAGSRHAGAARAAAGHAEPDTPPAPVEAGFEPWQLARLAPRPVAGRTA